MVASTNPYATPVTPSNDMATKARRESGQTVFHNSTAYRKGYTFYCEPDFESPLVCFKSAKSVDASCEKMLVMEGSTGLELYFSPQYLNELKWENLVKLLAVSALALFSAILAWMIDSPLAILPGVILLPLTIKYRNTKGIKVNLRPDGFLEITGAHPRFLKLFPDKGES